MSYYQQPWRRIVLDRRPCKLQVLDPDTAFELEPELIERVGETLLETLAAPAKLAAAVTDVADIETELARAVELMRRLADFAGSLLRSADIDGRWVASVFERVIFDKLELRGERYETWGDIRLSPRARWHVLGAQIAQSFGPVWARSPYNSGERKANDYGVPKVSSSKATQWAAALAAPTNTPMHDILTRWTPGAMMDAVEIAARNAAITRRASESSRAGA